MRYEEAMKYITGVGNFGSNYGLERTYKLLEYLGNPEKDLKLIHIAGTNGKGSTTSMITEILMGAGYKVGMYTSPFIEEFEERIQINRNNIPKETLAVLMDEVKEAVDKVIEGGYNHPTEFEIITVLMLLYFKRENIDFGVIEVGLGGTLDSTNVITPILQVITSISFDHTNLLGNTIEVNNQSENRDQAPLETCMVLHRALSDKWDSVLGSGLGNAIWWTEKLDVVEGAASFSPNSPFTLNIKVPALLRKQEHPI